MGAAASVYRNLAEAFGTLLAGRAGGNVGTVHAGDQHIDRSDYEEIDRGGNQQKRDGCVDEISDWKMCASDIEAQRRKVGRAYDGGNQGREQVFGKCGDNCGEGCADYYAYSHVHDISAQDELLESA